MCPVHTRSYSKPTDRAPAELRRTESEEPPVQAEEAVDTTRLLGAIYKGNPAEGLRGPKALYDQAQKEGLQVSLSDCRNFLQGLPAYTIYKPALRSYPRNRIVAHRPGEVVQVLVELIF